MVLSSVSELGLVTWILGPSFFETMPNKIERIFQLINRGSKNGFMDVTKTNNFSENLFQGQIRLAEWATSAVQLVENDGKTEKSSNKMERIKGLNIRLMRLLRNYTYTP